MILRSIDIERVCSSVLLTKKMEHSLTDKSEQCILFEKKIYFHKTNLQKYHTYNIIHTMYKKRQKIKTKRYNVL